MIRLRSYAKPACRSSYTSVFIKSRKIRQLPSTLVAGLGPPGEALRLPTIMLPAARPTRLSSDGPRPTCSFRCVHAGSSRYGCLVQVGNGRELEAVTVGLQFEPYRWRPCGRTWDSSRTVVVIIMLRRYKRFEPGMHRQRPEPP